MNEESAPDLDLDRPEQDLAARLTRERPVPPAEFRGALGRWLAEDDPGHGPRPERLIGTSALYLLAGLGVMALGSLQALGVL
jgi:hypothetical protein